MAAYAIGDIQGCFDELMDLLQIVEFSPLRDHLWLTGDLVNRGSKSLEVLRFVRSLGDRAIAVLGNHDLHLLAVAYGVTHPRPKDTFMDVLEADDRDELLSWLRRLPLLHHDAAINYTMVHAGLVPEWDLARAQACAAEVEQVLRGEEAVQFFGHMYGNQPDRWDSTLQGWPRLRFITNCFTRLRYCYADGRVDLKHKGAPGTQPDGQLPWFEVPGRRSADLKIVFGHWSTVGSTWARNVFGLDTGCVWGGKLSALCLDDGRWYSVPCAENCSPGAD